MATKKKIKLKKKFKVLILFVFIVCISVYVGKREYKKYLYQQTEEYKFQEKGYSNDTIKLFHQKLSDDHINFLLKEERIDYIDKLISEKYYIDENLEAYLEFYQKESKKSFYDIVALVNTGANKKWYENANTTDVSDYTMLVNKFNSLPDNYEVANIKKFSATYAYGDVSAEETCYNAFIEMAKAAKKDGITLILTSGYRSHESQVNTYNDFESKKGTEYADSYAARPGFSEHETGLALDILTYGGITDTFKTTETYAWLHEHAKEYGFIERYLEGKEYITGYAAEAWHYRYLGVELATKVYNEGITYDEYYAYYLKK